MSLWTGFTAARAAPYSRIQPPYSRIQPKEDDAVHKSRLGALIIDCKTDELTEAAAFWSAALDYEPAPKQTDDRYCSMVGGSEERREGKACGSPGRYRWRSAHNKIQTYIKN